LFADPRIPLHPAHRFDLDDSSRIHRGLQTDADPKSFQSVDGMGFINLKSATISTDNTVYFSLGNFYFLKITSPHFHSGEGIIKKWEVKPYVS